jgi:hypothetical protein
MEIARSVQFNGCAHRIEEFSHPASMEGKLHYLRVTLVWSGEDEEEFFFLKGRQKLCLILLIKKRKPS